MTFLKKQSTAIAITVIIAVLFSFIGCSLSLSRQAGKVEDMFTTGVYLDEESYVQPSIQSQLDKSAEAGLGLVTICNHYPELSLEAEAITEARRELLEAESYDEKYIAYTHYYKTVSSLIDLLKEGEVITDGELVVKLTDDDFEAFESYAGTVTGANGVIEKSEYNKKVTEFIRTKKSFPASIFGIFADEPDYFQVEG